MANVTEQSLWEVGVYQIETSDAVIGGVGGIANRQALQLANRTLWLKNQVAGLGTGKQDADSTLAALANLTTSANQMIYATGADQFALTPLTAFIRTLLDDADAATARTTIGAAPLASPALTGTPTAPTATDGTNTMQLATTAFVQSAVGGYISITSTGGTITLTGEQASNPMIGFGGALTSDLIVVVPNTVRRLWGIANWTTGNFKLIVKTASGTGVTVAQGKRNLVYTDGTNVYDGFNDFESISMTGAPTAPTAAAGTNTTQIATTAFVNAEIVADRPFEATTANIKMDGAQSVGVLNTVARGDHVHPTDTSRAPLASPVFTGTPTAPTAATGTRTTQLATTAFVGAESQIAAPVGSVYTFAGATVPTGWLKCNGALLSRTTYAALFAVIGTTYGAGDGSTTFALPDLRGEFVRGFDDGRGIDAGRALGSWRDHILQSHNHFLPTSTGTAGGSAVIADNLWTGGNSANYVAGTGWRPSTTYPNPLFEGGAEVGSIGNFGGETAPRSIAMHYIIKF